MAPKADPKKDAKKKEPKKEKKEVDADEAKIPEVVAPDKKEFEAKIEKLQTKIDAAQLTLKEVKDQIGDRSAGNSDFQTKRSALLEKVKAEKEQIDEYMKKKEEIRGAMGLKSSEDKKMSNELRDMKKKLGYTDVAQIEKRIKEIDDKMMHDSPSLKEEKAMMLEIATLKKSMPEVRKYNQLDQAAQDKRQMTDDRTPLKEQLDAINSVMQGHFDEKKKLNDQFQELLAERDASMGNSQEMYDKREKLNGEVKEFIQQRNELRDKFRQDERAYYEYQKELKNLRWEKQRAEREDREKEWQQEKRKRDADKLDDQPFVGETTLLEQTIKFCKSFQPKEAEEKKEAAATVFDNKQDEVVLVDKSKREEEFYYAPTKKKKNSKHKGSNHLDKGGVVKPIKHNAETFKLFASLKIEAPITTDDIPATLKKLEAMLEEYQGKVKDWEKTRDERRIQILDPNYIPPVDEPVDPPVDPVIDPDPDPDPDPPPAPVSEVLVDHIAQLKKHQKTNEKKFQQRKDQVAKINFSKTVEIDEKGTSVIEESDLAEYCEGLAATFDEEDDGLAKTLEQEIRQQKMKFAAGTLKPLVKTNIVGGETDGAFSVVQVCAKWDKDEITVNYSQMGRSWKVPDGEPAPDTEVMLDYYQYKAVGTMLEALGA